MEQMGCVGLGKLRFMLFVDEWGASECRCGYYRALASFHMALSPSKYPVTFILFLCLYSLSLHFPSPPSIPQHGSNNAYMKFTSIRQYFTQQKRFNCDSP